MALGSTQPLTDMSTRNLPGGKGPVRKADNIIAICVSRLSRKYRSLDVSQTYGPPWPVTGIALPFFLIGRTKPAQTSASHYLLNPVRVSVRVALYRHAPSIS
jgi:hypothetical protein